MIFQTLWLPLLDTHPIRLCVLAYINKDKRVSIYVKEIKTLLSAIFSSKIFLSESPLI